MSAAYRIEFSIQRAADDDADFLEVGFGSSGTWADLAACTHMLDSAVTNYEWETTPLMPDPDEIRAEIEGAR